MLDLGLFSFVVFSEESRSIPNQALNAEAMDMTHLERTNSSIMQTFLSTKGTLDNFNSYSSHLALSLHDACNHEAEAFVLYSQVFGQMNENTDYTVEVL